MSRTIPPDLEANSKLHHVSKWMSTKSMTRPVGLLLNSKAANTSFSVSSPNVSAQLPDDSCATAVLHDSKKSSEQRIRRGGRFGECCLDDDEGRVDFKKTGESEESSFLFIPSIVTFSCTGEEE